MGILGGVDFNKTELNGARSNPTGTGVSFEIFRAHLIGTGLQLRESLKYRFYQIKRNIISGGSGLYPTPPSLSVTQKLHLAGLGLTLAYQAREGGSDLIENPQLWMEGGLEALLPIAGSQSGDLGNINFTPSGHPIFVTLGISIGRLLEEKKNSFLALLQIYYHLNGQADNRIYGLRINLGYGI